MPGSPVTHENQQYAQYVGPTVLVTVDGAVHLSGPLVQGARYAIMCPDTDVYLRQGGAGLTVDATASRLAQGDIVFVNVDDITNNQIAVTTASGLGGNLRLTRVDSVAGFVTGAIATHRTQFFASYIGSSQQVSVGGASVPSVALAPGRYFMSCLETDIYVRQGGPAVVVTNADMLLPMGFGFYFNVDDASSNTIAVMMAALSIGTLRITRVDDVA